MTSTAHYYCDRGHRLVLTGNTFAHDAMLARPCQICLDEQHTADVHGPFPSLSNVEFIMGMRGVVGAEDRED
jgi:hypothetical protein